MTLLSDIEYEPFGPPSTWIWGDDKTLAIRRHST